MLTSERKICKLFIKFLEWDKIDKAANLIQTYPNLAMPWQKAFECASMNYSLRACQWINEQHRINVNNDDGTGTGTGNNTSVVVLDIHFNNDALFVQLVTRGCIDFVKWLVSLEPMYLWKNQLAQPLSGIRKDILVLFT